MDKDIDYAHRVVEILRQPDTQLTVFALSELLHVAAQPERVTPV